MIEQKQREKINDQDFNAMIHGVKIQRTNAINDKQNTSIFSNNKQNTSSFSNEQDKILTELALNNLAIEKARWQNQKKTWLSK